MAISRTGSMSTASATHALTGVVLVTPEERVLPAAVSRRVDMGITPDEICCGCEESVVAGVDGALSEARHDRVDDLVSGRAALSGGFVAGLQERPEHAA